MNTSSNNFNYHNNLGNNTINNYHTSTNSRFSTLQFSPSLENSTNTISFASINVWGINSLTKFETILEDLTSRSFSVIGLQETKTKKLFATSLYKNFSLRIATASLYKSYWDFNAQNAAADVDLLIASYISKYVQRIHWKDGRFIAIDLFLSAKKIKIINLYVSQASNFVLKGKAFTKFVINHIK